MSILVTTQSYRDDIPTEYGYLLEIDEKKGGIIRKLKIDTPVNSEKEDERLKPGLRGIYVYKGEIYVSTWNKIVIIDQESFEIVKELSHKWMSDLHGIYVDEEGIWVTSSLPDAVILYDFKGNPRSSLWISESKLYDEPKKVDKEKDWRWQGKYFRGFHQYHANHITLNNDWVYITGRSRNDNGRVIRIKKENFLNKDFIKNSDIEIFARHLHGPHDGLWINGNFWVTETNGSTIAKINIEGKVVKREKVKREKAEAISYDGLWDFIKSKIRVYILNKSDKKITHWTRGLGYNNGSLFVGQSTDADNECSYARIAKVNKNTLNVDDFFVLDIPNYPETRIFQVYNR